MNEKLIHIGSGKIFADPNQPRKTFDRGELEKIATSLKARGFLQPIRVCYDLEREAYRIVLGESRWRAAQLAGITEIPCMVVEGEPDDASLLIDRLIENVCRSNLKPMELGRGIATLKALRRCSSQDVAAQLGISGASRLAGRIAADAAGGCAGRWWMTGDSSRVPPTRCPACPTRIRNGKWPG